jgi:hypothetical protein
MFKQSRKLAGYSITFPQVATNKQKTATHLDNHQTKQTNQPNTKQTNNQNTKKPLQTKENFKTHNLKTSIYGSKNTKNKTHKQKNPYFVRIISTPQHKKRSH